MPDVETLKAELKTLRQKFIALHRQLADLAASSSAAVTTLSSEREMNAILTEEVERLRKLTEVSMGVGDGKGQLFVYGSHEAISALQAILLTKGDQR